MKTSSLVSCRGVSLAYEGKTVLKDIDLDIPSGDFLCIIGDNGSGKSTLIKALLGLKAPFEGKITYAPQLKGESIGYVPQQNPIQKDFPASVWEVVLSGCISASPLLPFFSSAAKKTAAENLERVGALDLKKKSYMELSGGQQQRVLLARALCSAKSIIYLDEPTSSLDPAATEECLSLLKKLNDGGLSVVMISHDLASVLPYAKRILHIKKDGILLGDREEYLKENGGSDKL